MESTIALYSGMAFGLCLGITVVVMLCQGQHRPPGVTVGTSLFVLDILQLEHDTDYSTSGLDRRAGYRYVCHTHAPWAFSCT